MQDLPPFDLEKFFPYKVRIFYRAVSERVADIYKERYGLSVQEWRIMAVLGPTKGLSASEMVQRSSMDKVTISRAISKLTDRGYINQEANPRDGRRVTLQLSEEGRTLFDELVPQVLDVEQLLLADLSPDERTQLSELMRKVRLAAED